MKGQNPLFPVIYAAGKPLILELLNSTYTYTQYNPFLVFHTYEYESNFTPAYYMAIPPATTHRLNNDLIRNIRWNLLDGAPPWLTYPDCKDNEAIWEGDEDSPQEVIQISFFVDRKGRIVLWYANGERPGRDMVWDALREEF